MLFLVVLIQGYESKESVANIFYLATKQVFHSYRHSNFHTCMESAIYSRSDVNHLANVDLLFKVEFVDGGRHTRSSSVFLSRQTSCCVHPLQKLSTTEAVFLSLVCMRRENELIHFNFGNILVRIHCCNYY